MTDEPKLTVQTLIDLELTVQTLIDLDEPEALLATLQDAAKRKAKSRIPAELATRWNWTATALTAALATVTAANEPPPRADARFARDNETKSE